MEEHFPNSNAGPVLLFDGECGLCHRVVRGLLKCDRRERLRFAPLHGAAAQVWLRERGLPTTDFTTLIFVHNWVGPAREDYLERTAAVIAALRLCNRCGRSLALLLGLIPRPIRDAGYRAVSRVRQRLFGRPPPVPFSDPCLARRFID
jgi:predicted DCC family thiol-disulfide oxidoreductase YuxK